MMEAVPTTQHSASRKSGISGRASLVRVRGRGRVRVRVRVQGVEHLV